MKTRVSSNQHILRETDSLQRPITRETLPPFSIRIIRHYHHQIVIRIRPGVSASVRAEQPDRFRLISFHEAANGFLESLVNPFGNLNRLVRHYSDTVALDGD